MDSNSGHPSVSPGTKFYRGGSLLPKFFLKTVADVRPTVRVTVREKGPDFKFSGTSICGKVLFRILWDPAVTWYTKFFFYGGRTLSSSQFRIWPLISVWQFIPMQESKFTVSRNPIAKFSVPRPVVVLISKFSSKILVLWGLSVPRILLPKFTVLAS